MLVRRFLLAALMAGMLPLCAADSKAEEGARKVMDEFMAAFNARDVQAWAAALNYPHVRFASNEVRVYNNAEEFARENADYPKRLGHGITAGGSR